METEYISYIKNFKNSLQSQISEFSFKVENYVNEIESKNKHFEKLEKKLNNQEDEIVNMNKVSFVKQLDKQLEEQKKITKVHELRLKSLQKINQNLKKQNQKLKEGSFEFDYSEFDSLFTNVIQKRMNKNQIIDEVKKMYMIIRGESVLNNTLDKLEKVKNKKVNRKNKKNNNNNNNNNNSNDNDKDQDQLLIQKEDKDTKIPTIEEDTDIHKTYEESDKSEEDTVDKVETEKSESEQEPESEQDETIVKKNYTVTSIIKNDNEIQYTEIEFKNKNYYLNKITNKVFRKRKSGKVGKQYAYISSDNCTLIKL